MSNIIMYMYSFVILILCIIIAENSQQNILCVNCRGREGNAECQYPSNSVT